MTQELTNPSPGNLKIDESRGAPFLLRAGASIKLKDEDRFNFLESVLGKGHVFSDNENRLYIRDPDNPGSIIPFDEEGFTVKDITADIAGEALQAAPAIAASPTIGGAALGAAAGSVLRQTVAAALPGKEEQSLMGVTPVHILIHGALQPPQVLDFSVPYWRLRGD